MDTANIQQLSTVIDTALARVNEEFDRVKEVIRADLLARGYDGLTALPPPQFNTSYQDSVDRPRR